MVRDFLENVYKVLKNSNYVNIDKNYLLITISMNINMIFYN